MHVVVVGCGRVGSQLAIALEAGGHTVGVIDKNPNAFRWLPPGFKGRQVQGMGFDRGHLEQAGIKEAQAFASVTNGDNTNILSARIARETYGVTHVVARIYDPQRAEVYQNLGIPTVASVAWTTDQVLRRLFPDQSVTEWTDPTGSVCLVERALPPAWAGKELSKLDQEDRFQLAAVSRLASARLSGPDLVGQEGDVLHLVVRREAMEELEARLAHPEEAG